MCDYTGHEFGASYPDSCCIDGYLWDLDSCDEPGGPLHNGGDIPCPACNHAAWLEDQREEIVDEGWMAAEESQPIENNPYRNAERKLLFEVDRPLMFEWWRIGWLEHQKEQAQKQIQEQAEHPVASVTS